MQIRFCNQYSRIPSGFLDKKADFPPQTTDRCFAARPADTGYPWTARIYCRRLFPQHFLLPPSIFPAGRKREISFQTASKKPAATKSG